MRILMMALSFVMMYTMPVTSMILYRVMVQSGGIVAGNNLTGIILMVIQDLGIVLISLALYLTLSGNMIKIPSRTAITR
jgi:hypothetical protein